MHTIFRHAPIGVLVLAMAGLTGCFHNTDETVALSGTITATAGNVTDSDVNDPNAPYAANDTMAQAQYLPNPFIAGGFVSRPGTVRTGRLAGSGTGDVNDYYLLTLLEGQTVTLTVGDPSGINYVFGIGAPPGANTNDIDLYLHDSNQVELLNADASRKSVVAPATGQYYLRVQADTGASDYLLSTGASACQTAVSGVSANADLNINDSFVPGEIIVKFKEQSPPAGVAVNAMDDSLRLNVLGLQRKAGAPGRSQLLNLVKPNRSRQVSNGVSALNDASDPTQLKIDTLEAVKALRARDDVEYAKPNYIRHAAMVPNDTEYNLQWNLPLINLPTAWDTTTGTPDVIVAVIDTGILPGHPDLGASRLVAGYDFISDPDLAADGDGLDPDPFDPSEFHGTHVAGIITAQSNNSRGVAGVAWNVRLMPLRVLGPQGGTDYDIEQAVLYAAGLGNDAETAQQTAARVAAGEVADVINLSLGGATVSTAAPPAYQQARQQGLIIVAAAGNNSSCELSYPASLEGVVSVSAVDSVKTIADYSNVGTTIDVAAPGGSSTAGIYSLWAINRTTGLQYTYEYQQGTSMAAPHVAGVAALMKSVNPNLTPALFDSLLAGGVLTEDLGTAGRDNAYGYGLIDASKAVLAANMNLQDLNPLLAVTPLSLQFAVGVSASTFSLTNSGGGTLTATIAAGLPAWLSVVATADVNTSGLGTYAVQIDRSLLPSLPTTGVVINIDYTGVNAQNVTSSGTVNLPVIVYSQNFTANAGYHYIYLYHADSLDAEEPWEFRKDEAGISDGRYRYTLTQVPAGRYVIVAGSDINGNGFIFDRPDAIGVYPDLGHFSEIDVGDSDLSGLNFVTGYYLYFGSNLNTRATEMVRRIRIK